MPTPDFYSDDPTKYTLDVRYPNKLGKLYKTGLDNILFPNEIQNEGFYTIFRVSERQAKYNEGRVGVTGSTDEVESNIVLPLPPNLGTAYGVNYTGTEFGVFTSALVGAGGAAQEALNKGGDLGDALTAGVDNLVGGAIDSLKTDFVGALGDGLEKLVLLAGRSALGTSAGQAIGAGIGVAKNPYQAIVFQNPNFRTHSFSYNLFASNQNESDAIARLIYVFKRAMFPSFVGDGLFFRYPKVFDIQHVAGTADNPFMFKVGTSALTDFSVDYHGDGTPSYFERPDHPAPTNIRINMTFQELTILTQEDFDRANF
jgi:hypothetical protein